jgi:hypothetical protein
MTKYIVETVYKFKEFDEYRDAEIYCGENNIPCDCIYEEEYAENRYEKLMNGIIRKFGFEAKETLCFCNFCEVSEKWEDATYANLCVETMYMAFMDDKYVSVAEQEENEEY